MSIEHKELNNLSKIKLNPLNTVSKVGNGDPISQLKDMEK